MSLTACNECPFPIISSKTIHERTKVSMTLGNRVSASLEKFKQRVPIDANVINDIGGNLSYEIENYEHEPIDSLLTVNYNLQARKMCGLYKMWKAAERTQKEMWGLKLNEAMAQLFAFSSDYGDGKPVKSVYEYEVNLDDKEVPASIPEIKPDAKATLAKIEQYLKSKINNSHGEEREYWEEAKKNSEVYINTCMNDPDPPKCLNDFWQELQTLSQSY